MTDFWIYSHAHANWLFSGMPIEYSLGCIHEIIVTYLGILILSDLNLIPKICFWHNQICDQSKWQWFITFAVLTDVNFKESIIKYKCIDRPMGIVWYWCFRLRLCNDKTTHMIFLTLLELELELELEFLSSIKRPILTSLLSIKRTEKSR